MNYLAKWVGVYSRIGYFVDENPDCTSKADFKKWCAVGMNDFAGSIAGGGASGQGADGLWERSRAPESFRDAVRV